MGFGNSELCHYCYPFLSSVGYSQLANHIMYGLLAQMEIVHKLLTNKWSANWYSGNQPVNKGEKQQTERKIIATIKT